MSRHNEHYARAAKIGLFIKDSMRSIKLENGVRQIAGKLKSNPEEITVQCYRFNNNTFTIDQAKEWLENNSIDLRLEEAKKIQSFEKEITLQCTAMALSPEEIRQNVPMNVMADLKNRDDSPHLRAYSIVQDGIATPRVIGGADRLPTKWSTKVVQSVKSVIKKGVQFFVGHNADNSTDGRRSVGEVVANFQKKIGDKLHSIVVGYFPDKNEASKYDVCSIEGTILAQDFDNYSVVKGIKDITGIALGSSDRDTPAFNDAVYLGSIQAFDDSESTRTSETKKREEITEMTFDEIKNHIRNKNIWPSQIFSEDDLKMDRVFGKVFDEVESSTNKLTEVEKEFNEQLTAKDDKIKQLEKDMTLVTAQDKLNKSYPDGLTDLQKQFINKNFKPETMDDLSEENMKSFIDNSIKEYAEYAKLFGKTEEEPAPNVTESNTEEMDDVDKIVNEVINEPQGV